MSPIRNMDEFEYFVDDESYESDSLDSDSGISSGSSTISTSTNYDEPTDEFIKDLMEEIKSQNAQFIREMIVFSINGALADDTRLCSSAMVFLWKLFKLTAGFDGAVAEKILTNCPELLSSIKALVLDKTKSKELHFYVSGIFYYASKSKIGSDQIIETSIDALLSMMGSSIKAVVHYSFTCIHNILLNVPKSRDLISKNYDLSSLIQHLSSLNGCLESRLELITIDILSRLATKHEQNKKILLSKKILHKCLKTVMVSSTSKAVIVHGHLIRVLSTNAECKDCLLRNQAFIKFLVTACLQINESHTNRIFWSIVLNISDKLLVAVNGCQVGIPKLINRMVRSIRNVHKIPVSQEMVGIFLCCLSNFSCHQEWVKDIIWKVDLIIGKRPVKFVKTRSMVKEQMEDTRAIFRQRIENYSIIKLIKKMKSKGVQYTIIELLKTETEASSSSLTVNIIEACYRCLNHIMSRILAFSDDFMLKHYSQITPVLDQLNLRTQDDLHEKLIRLSINESKEIEFCSKVEQSNLIIPIRSWIILMTHIMTIETERYSQRDTDVKEYQTMMKAIKFEISNVSTFLTDTFLRKPLTRSEEEEATVNDIMSHLDILMNIKSV